MGSRLWLAMGLATALWGGCGDSESPDPSRSESPANEGDEQDDSQGSKGGKGDAHVDARKPVPDAGRAPDDESDPPTEADAPWCKAKAIFDKYCVSCHDGEGSGGSPMGLTSLADLQADAATTPGKKVYELVGARIHDAKRPMPPQKKLSAEELATLDAFVAAKAPAGARCAAETPDAGTPEDSSWKPESCDAIYKIYAHGATLDEPFQVPPGQEIHPQVSWDAPWGDEKVQMINVRPITDNKKVLHHWILYAGQGGFLAGWAPGNDDRSEYPPDIGMNLPSGARSLRLDMHYFNTMGTKTEPDKSGLEICVVKGAHLRPKAAAVMTNFASFGPVLAPAGANNKPITGTCNVKTTTPVTLMTSGPHAHTTAVHMKFTVKKKNGQEIVLHDADFSFHEQRTYDLDPQVVLETGDTVYTTCSYTNPTTRNITFGESTSNEMCFNFATYWPAGALSCSGFGGFDLGNLGNLGNLINPPSN